MKTIIGVIISVALLSCAIRSNELIVNKKLTETIVLGTNSAHSLRGVWIEYLTEDNNQNTRPTYRRIFGSPDSILIEDSYVYLREKKKHCLILRNLGDSVNYFKDIIKSRNKSKIDSLIFQNQ